MTLHGASAALALFWRKPRGLKPLVYYSKVPICLRKASIQCILTANKRCENGICF